MNIGRFANQTIWYKSINFIPILTIDVKTFLLNILMMVPFGICLPLLGSNFRTAASVAKSALCVSLSLEVMQMIIRVTLGSGRSTDINDIIANTLGGVFDFLIYKRRTHVKAVRCMMDRYRLG
ncbi:VanZ family protein [Paenibacillus sp. sptzw28]|uniref:VanZ family protein n=1 Tax=Paenibacillus sp. sptzw28 TaxID=715179 RepID=UPI0037CB0EE0